MNRMGDSVLINVGVYVGRFNPIHLGHQEIINTMIYNHTLHHSILFVGSANARVDLRNLFTYKERRDFIKFLYPDLNVMPLADQANDSDWFESLIDMIDAVFPFYHHINLYCGDLVDIANFPHEEKITIKVVPRYEGVTAAATDVRRAIMLEQKKVLRDLVDGRIAEEVYARGRYRLEAMLKGEM
jgi:cytidyltransferase-like protein